MKMAIINWAALYALLWYAHSRCRKDKVRGTAIIGLFKTAYQSELPDLPRKSVLYKRDGWGVAKYTVVVKSILGRPKRNHW